MSEPFESYVADDQVFNWSDDLEVLHEESSRAHFIDRWTRRAIIARAGALPLGPTMIDIGCSSGYLLEDPRSAFPRAELIGADLTDSGLRRAHLNVPDARLLKGDACDLPLGDESVDCVVNANLLEHVSKDRYPTCS